MKTFLLLALAATLSAQYTPPAGGGGGGSGTVTSVTLAGTANQITATGNCAAQTVTITCTLSLPSGLVLPGTIDGLTITTTTGTLTIASAKTVTFSKTLTFTGTDGVTLTFPATNATIARTDAAQTFTGLQTFTDGIGTGSSAPSLTPGTGGATAAGEGTAPSVCPTTGVDCLYADSTQHGYLANFNNLGYLPLVQGPASTTNLHMAQWSGTNGGKLIDLATTGSGSAVLAASPTLSGTTTIAASGIVDLGTNNAQFKNMVQAPVYQANTVDCISVNTTGGSPASPSGCANAGTTETVFSDVITLPVNTPGAGRGIEWDLGFDDAGQATPSAQFKLYACLAANFSIGGSPPVATCSSGGQTLWISASSATITTNGAISSGSYTFRFGVPTLGTVITNMFGNTGNVKGTDTSASAITSVTASVPMTTGTWKIYLTCKFTGTTTAGNWYAITQSIVPYIY